MFKCINNKSEINVDESDEGKISERSIGLFPILPTFGFTWEF